MTAIFGPIRHGLLKLAGALAWLPPLVARFTLGYVFIESGWGKLHNLAKVIEFFRSLGIPAPELQAPFAAGAELVCGALVLAGLATRFASIPLIVIMIVAIATAKREELAGISELLGFIEYLYAVLALWLAIAGPGSVSLDRLIFGPEPVDKE